MCGEHLESFIFVITTLYKTNPIFYPCFDKIKINFFLFQCFNVLEPFRIDKYPFTAITTYYVDWNFLMRIKFMRHIRHKTHKLVIYFFRGIFTFIQSFFIPSIFSTKNYIYGRLALLAIKSYFRLFAKKKILFFWRHNVQVLKIKIQLKFQQNIKTNFGGHYPFHGRLLNYYPFFVVVFFLVICHNFNGLFFYGFQIQLFFYKIL